MVLLPNSGPTTRSSDREERLKSSSAVSYTLAQPRAVLSQSTKMQHIASARALSTELSQVTFYPTSIQPSQPFILQVTPWSLHISFAKGHGLSKVNTKLLPSISRLNTVISISFSKEAQTSRFSF